MTVRVSFAGKGQYSLATCIQAEFQRPQPGVRGMGFKQTATHRYRQGFVPSDRPGARPVRQRADGQVGQVRPGDRLRRLGRSELGARPRQVRAPTPAPRPTPRSASTWPRSTAWKSSPSPPTCKARPWATSRAPRRCSSSAARRWRRTRPGATRATSRRAPIPISSPTKSAS